MKKLFRFLVLGVLLSSPLFFTGCGPSRISNDEAPVDIGDEGDAEEEDANPPAEE